ncbi:trans-resveratrol di-O-methyltransferase-like [Coffea eugenioides]|uniref:trans-resveratrol di-O-methyltransferase-like n=1 Tax=Coffea eugenioides TaxID=49369 RepID=UPI000F60999B|nr:trans-resveratrol di-O-methyltransferase-like [Coffea eugenioides]
MASDSRLVGSILIRECKDVFSGFNSLVDVGGGTLAKEIADAFLDLNSNNKSLAFAGGNMFVAIPPADDVIMKQKSRPLSAFQEVAIRRTIRKQMKVPGVPGGGGGGAEVDGPAVSSADLGNEEGPACVKGRVPGARTGPRGVN